MDCSSKSVWLPNIYIYTYIPNIYMFLKKDRSGFVMICDTICGYCRKERKSAHGIEEVYMYFNGSGIWGGEILTHLTTLLTINEALIHFKD